MSGFAMIGPQHWRARYGDALHEHGDGAFRRLKIAIAISACVSRLLQVAPEATLEREEISIALDDLKILSALHRKYR
jgi:hypothetical protein